MKSSLLKLTLLCLVGSTAKAIPEYNLACVHKSQKDYQYALKRNEAATFEVWVAEDQGVGIPEGLSANKPLGDVYAVVMDLDGKNAGKWKVFQKGSFSFKPVGSSFELKTKNPKRSLVCDINGTVHANPAITRTN